MKQIKVFMESTIAGSNESIFEDIKVGLNEAIDFEKANKIKQGLKCCSEFLCDECPYQKYDNKEYKMRCIHMLVVDANQIINKGE